MAILVPIRDFNTHNFFWVMAINVISTESMVIAGAIKLLRHFLCSYSFKKYTY
ncbi:MULTISPECIES: hypothetical protein [unclassified Paenibacillus]|uniref:hypothetical protein n=1 Tax=unclassified Paenibacillus TaxID=185978 RepID=UPI00363EFD07